jgi:hypothetical protein
MKKKQRSVKKEAFAGKRYTFQLKKSPVGPEKRYAFSPKKWLLGLR